MAKYYKEVLDKFYKRCKTNPNYSVGLVLNDEIALSAVKNSEFCEKNEDIEDIFFSNDENCAAIWFKNNSKMVFGLVDSFKKEYEYNVWLFDKSIRQEKLDKHVGHGVEYELEGADCSMLNFDPIPVKMTEPQFIDCLSE